MSCWLLPIWWTILDLLPGWPIMCSHTFWLCLWGQEIQADQARQDQPVWPWRDRLPKWLLPSHKLVLLPWFLLLRCHSGWLRLWGQEQLACGAGQERLVRTWWDSMSHRLLPWWSPLGLLPWRFLAGLRSHSRWLPMIWFCSTQLWTASVCGIFS